MDARKVRLKAESLWKVVTGGPLEALKRLGQAVTTPTPALLLRSSTETCSMIAAPPPVPSWLWTSTKYWPFCTNWPVSLSPSQTIVIPLPRTISNWDGVPGDPVSEGAITEEERLMLKTEACPGLET